MKVLTNTGKEIDVKPNAPLSPYAQFHFKYLGYMFVNNATRQRYKIGAFWDYFRDEVKETLLTDKIIAPPGFSLIKRIKLNGETIS